MKAMLEAAFLPPEELARAVDLCVEAGITYVKNSSGLRGGDATPSSSPRSVASLRAGFG